MAVEIFFSDRTSLFINLHTSKKAAHLAACIRNQVHPPLLGRFLGRRPITIMRKTMIPARLAGGCLNASNLYPSGKQNLVDSNTAMIRLKDAWINREISNFDYLMKLNTIAGRTYNDLGQYPVFPWVLSDYHSPVLDLKDSHSFRDLKYPMGAQNKKMRVEQQAKYRDLQEAYDSMHEALGEEGAADAGVLPPFHWGSHYSVAGFVLWYLLRLEPFTSLHVQLQDGRFDKADRIFSSVAAAYEGCTNNPSDVKELVPEMFYLPEALLNNNKVNFGFTQKGEAVDDVKLPPWAADAHDFIFQHRLALESDYVSNNIHRWIDLIFGCRQRPPHLGGTQECVDSCNVFFHLTYSGAVNLDELKDTDPLLYEQYACQIAEFGQTPTQLFTKPHESRKSFRDADIFWPIASCVIGVDTIEKENDIPDLPERIYSFKPIRVAAQPIVFICELSSVDKLLTIDTSRTLGQHIWTKLPPDLMPPFKFKLDSQALDASLDAHYMARADAFATSASSGPSMPFSLADTKGSSRSGGFLSSIGNGVVSMLRGIPSSDRSITGGINDETGGSSSSNRRRASSSIMGSMGKSMSMAMSMTSTTNPALRIGVPFSPLLTTGNITADSPITMESTNPVKGGSTIDTTPGKQFSTASSRSSSHAKKSTGNATPTRNSFFGGLFSPFGNGDATNGELDSVGMGDGGVGASNHTPISLVNTGRKADVEYAKSRATIISSSLKKRNLYEEEHDKSIDPFKACSAATKDEKAYSSNSPPRTKEKSDKNGKGRNKGKELKAENKSYLGSGKNTTKPERRRRSKIKHSTVSEPRINGKLFAVLEDSHFRYLSTSQSDIFGNASTTATGSGMSSGSESSRAARLLFSCGHHDNTLRITNLDSGRLVHAVRKHSDLVTCLTLTSDHGQWWSQGAWIAACKCGK